MLEEKSRHLLGSIASLREIRHSDNNSPRASALANEMIAHHRRAGRIASRPSATSRLGAPTQARCRRKRERDHPEMSILRSMRERAYEVVRRMHLDFPADGTDEVVDMLCLSICVGLSIRADTRKYSRKRPDVIAVRAFRVWRIQIPEAIRPVIAGPATTTVNLTVSVMLVPARTTCPALFATAAHPAPATIQGGGLVPVAASTGWANARWCVTTGSSVVDQIHRASRAPDERACWPCGDKQLVPVGLRRDVNWYRSSAACSLPS